MNHSIKRILLVSYYLPSRGHGGGLRLLDMYGVIRGHFPRVGIDLVACRQSVEEVAEEALHHVFDRIHLLDAESFSSAGFQNAGLLNGQYDVVDLQYLQSGKLIPSFRKCGTKRIIFSPMESMVRAAWVAMRALWRSLSVLHLRRVGQHLRYSIQELWFALNADCVLCVSENDASVIRALQCNECVFAVETGVSPLEFPISLSTTSAHRELDLSKRVVFVAFFGSQTNREALAWYLSDVHPIISAAVPGYSFEVVGRGLESIPTSDVGNLDIVGQVDSIEEQLTGAWVGIAPALSGAGLRGKINQYAIAGVPCVASVLAAEGFAYRDGESICLAANATEFAERCIGLLSSREFNLTVGRSARQICLESYVWNKKIDELAMVYDLRLNDRKCDIYSKNKDG